MAELSKAQGSNSQTATNRDGIEPLTELPAIHLPDLNSKRTSEDDFMVDLVRASNTVVKYLVLAAGIVPTKPLAKNQAAALIGHMVRLFKLYDSYLMLATKKRAEIALIISRSLVETIINLRFFINFGTEELFAAYQRASLAYEKRLWDEIQKRKHDPVWPIEERMLASIKQTFERAGIEMDSVSWQDRNWGGDAYQKAEKTDLLGLYEFGFRSASHFVHGTWHELEFHDLQEKNGLYYPEPAYTTPKPQMMEGLTISCLEVASEYLQHISGEDVTEVVAKIKALVAWFEGMVHEHEGFLATLETERGKP